MATTKKRGVGSDYDPRDTQVRKRPYSADTELKRPPRPGHPAYEKEPKKAAPGWPRHAQVVLVRGGVTCDGCRCDLWPTGLHARFPDGWRLLCAACWGRLVRHQAPPVNEPVPVEEARADVCEADIRPQEITPFTDPVTIAAPKLRAAFEQGREEMRQELAADLPAIPPTPPSARHVAIVSVGDTHLNLIMFANGTWDAIAWLERCGNWWREDLELAGYDPTPAAVEAACREATGLPLELYDHAPQNDLMLFSLRCPLESHPERWRLTRIDELVGATGHAKALRTASIWCWGELASYLQRHGLDRPVKGIGAKTWRLLLDMVRDAWVKGTAQGQRGEVPDWLPAEALTVAEREAPPKKPAPVPAPPKPVAPVHYAWDITYSINSGTEERTVVLVAKTEKEARRRALMKPNAKEIISIRGMTREAYHAAHGHRRPRL